MGEGFFEEIERRALVVDGAMGSLLQRIGVKKGVCAEQLNLSSPNIVKSIHLQYVEQGADIVTTNTFRGNGLSLREFGLEKSVGKINSRAVEIAREAAGKERFVFGDVGPLDDFVEPWGKIGFEDAVSAFRGQIKALGKADAILIETMADIKMAKAAVIGAKESTQKPVVCSMAFDGERTSTGTDAVGAATILGGLGAEVLGLNCGCPPKELMPAAKKLSESTNLPLWVCPNAGVPEYRGNGFLKEYYANEFTYFSQKFLKLGFNFIGSCCGSTPLYTRTIKSAVAGLVPVKRSHPISLRASSRAKTVSFTRPVAIGECINPANRKKLASEIREKKTDFIKGLAIKQQAAGAEVLDVCVSAAQTGGLSLAEAVEAVEKVSSLPVSLDEVDAEELEKALRNCAGRPIINSVNGSRESMEKILPLAKKYGAAVVGLTLDEKGIPETAEGRKKIAEKIIERAEREGIRKDDLLIDCIVSTAAAEKGKAKVTLEAVEKVKEMGAKTILGISNISLGLPGRKELNVSFLCQALGKGLDAAIINPLEESNIQALQGFEEFETQDLDGLVKQLTSVEKREISKSLPLGEQLKEAVVFGLEEGILPIVENALEKEAPLKVNGFLVEGMKEVGKKFEKKEFFLPNVLLSAGTMKIAFTKVKEKIAKESGEKGFTIVFATVKHDVHDLGKNIVIALLESFGYWVVDLGKNVDEKRIAGEAKRHSADLVCLSALMTTTMEEMREVKKELAEQGVKAPLMVGGAVVNSEFAEEIGAIYGKDALEAVKKVKECINAAGGK